jgi:5-methylcytosine-specific restriction protein A
VRRCIDCGTLAGDATRCPVCVVRRDRRRGSATARGYGADYRRLRSLVVVAGAVCWRCGAPATTADHVPPLRSVAHPSLWVGELRPACTRCNYGHGASGEGKAKR